MIWAHLKCVESTLKQTSRFKGKHNAYICFLLSYNMQNKNLPLNFVLLEIKVKGRIYFLLHTNGNANENKHVTEHYKSKRGTVQVITS